MATLLGQVLVTQNGCDSRMLHAALTLWAERWGVRDAALHAGILVIVPNSGMTARAMARIVDELAQREDALASRLFWNEREGLIEPR